MKTGILSIKPEFADRIFTGTKKYEFRRKAPRADAAFRLLIYATAPRRALVGEIVVDEIVTDTPKRLWTRTRDAAGIDEARFLEYFHGLEKANALKISHAQAYDESVNLSELKALPGGFFAPQFLAWLAPERLASLRGQVGNDLSQ